MKYRRSAYAASSLRAYRCHLRVYQHFCASAGCCPVPASQETLCRFAAFLARSRSSSSVRQYLNIVRLVHLELGLNNPLADNFHLKTLLNGIRRSSRKSMCQKLPLTIGHLTQIRSVLDLNAIPDACFFAILTTCFFGLLRIGNVTRGSHDPSFVTRGDVVFCACGLLLRVRRSKTIQFGERLHNAVLPSYPGHPLCPVSALRNFLALSGDGFDSSVCLFSFRNRHSLFVPSAYWVRSKLRKILSQLHLPSSSFSTHSLRRGGATWLLNAGVPLHVIRLLGDWKSDAVFQYLRPSPENCFSLFPSTSKL